MVTNSGALPSGAERDDHSGMESVGPSGHNLLIAFIDLVDQMERVEQTPSRRQYREALLTVKRLALTIESAPKSGAASVAGAPTDDQSVNQEWQLSLTPRRLWFAELRIALKHYAEGLQGNMGIDNTDGGTDAGSQDAAVVAARAHVLKLCEQAGSWVPGRVR